MPIYTCTVCHTCVCVCVHVCVCVCVCVCVSVSVSVCLSVCPSVILSVRVLVFMHMHVCVQEVEQSRLCQWRANVICMCKCKCPQLTCQLHLRSAASLPVHDQGRKVHCQWCPVECQPATGWEGQHTDPVHSNCGLKK